MQFANREIEQGQQRLNFGFRAKNMLLTDHGANASILLTNENALSDQTAAIGVVETDPR